MMQVRFRTEEKTGLSRDLPKAEVWRKKAA
jgi:hypothetical protein